MLEHQAICAWRVNSFRRAEAMSTLRKVSDQVFDGKYVGGLGFRAVVKHMLWASRQQSVVSGVSEQRTFRYSKLQHVCDW